MAKQKGKFAETSGMFKLRGVINGLSSGEKNFGFKNGVTKKGVNYNSIRFKIKTSEDNNPIVESFGTEQQYAYFYNKSTKETAKIKWSDRKFTKIDGYEIIEPSFDLCERLYTDFKDGDSVVVIGKIRFGTYTNSRTQKVELQRRLEINQIYKESVPMSFNSDDFKETSEFSQEIIVNRFVDVDTEKSMIDAFVIGYNDTLSPARFFINKDECCYNAIKKVSKFGTKITVCGNVNHRASTKFDPVWGVQIANGKADESLQITGAIPDRILHGYLTEKDVKEMMSKQSEIETEKEPNFTAEKITTLQEADVSDVVSALPFDL